jgi:quercetin dioxygenase-like cupin family protein
MRFFLTGIFLFTHAMACAAPIAETLHNDKVVVFQANIPAGGSETIAGGRPSLTIYTQGGAVEVTDGAGSEKSAIARGQVVFREAKPHVVRNTGATPLEYTRIEFVTKGEPGAAPWGMAGLSPNYKMLLENQYARVYDIKIPAGTSEPQHTHKVRVVVCLSGAQVFHVMPDGRREPSTLKTGEVAWRQGSTHVGQNVGKTDLWVIATEPK